MKSLCAAETTTPAALWRWPLARAAFWPLVFWLVGIDLAFMVVNFVAFALHKADMIADVPVLLKITADWSLPEIFGYVKWLVIMTALLFIARRDRSVMALLWAAVFLLIFADDAFQFHENTGAWLSGTYGFQDRARLYGSDIGELTYFFAAGTAVLVLVALVVRNRGTAAYVMSKRYVLVLAGLGVFGVGADAVHQVIAHLTTGMSFGWLMEPIFALIEDGGEMVVGSVAVAMTLAIQLPRSAAEPQG